LDASVGVIKMVVVAVVSNAPLDGETLLDQAVEPETIE
jgi:hypothetical protein